MEVGTTTLDRGRSHVESARGGPVNARWEWPGRETWGHLGLFVLVAVTYGIGSRLALLLIEQSGLSSVFFIPAGLTAAFLLRTERRHWWLVALGVLVMEGTMDLLAGYSVGATAGYAAANALGPVVGAEVVRRQVGFVDLARLRHLWWFIVGSVLLGPATSALVGSGPAHLLGEQDFSVQFWQWWLGDSVGVLLVGAAILVWGSSRDRRSVFSGWGGALLATTLLVAVIEVTAARLPLLFVVLIGVATAGTVFGPRAVAITALLVGFVVAFDVALVGDPLVPGLTAAEGLIVVKFQLAVFALAGLLSAAEAHERELASTGARQAEIDKRTAAWLQEALLPELPAPHAAVSVAARYEPGSESLLVGGDWYDVIPLSEERIAITLGDVVGHGLEATTAMGRLRIAISVLARHFDEPGVLLANLDEYARDRGGVEYATASYAILDTSTGVLTFASAGHPPMLLLSPTGEYRWLEEGRSPPLHTRLVPGRGQGVVEVQPGSLLVGYTDGLVERRGEAVNVGLQRLLSTTRELADLPVSDICEGLVVGMGVGGARDDDVVVVVLRYEPQTESSPSARDDPGEGVEIGDPSDR